MHATHRSLPTHRAKPAHTPTLQEELRDAHFLIDLFRSTTLDLPEKYELRARAWLIRNSRFSNDPTL